MLKPAITDWLSSVLDVAGAHDGLLELLLENRSGIVDGTLELEVARVRLG